MSSIHGHAAGVRLPMRTPSGARGASGSTPGLIPDTAMRTITLVLILVLPSCGYVERERRAAAETAREATVAEVDQILTRAIRAADRTPRSAERILRPLPVMTPGEQQALRRFLAPQHLARARTLGVRVGNRAARDSRVAAGRLVRLPDSTGHWIVRRGTAPAHVLPELREVLEVVARRFQQRIGELGLPPYRIEITSALRTAEGASAPSPHGIRWRGTGDGGLK